MKTKIFNSNLVLLKALFMGLFMFISCDKVDYVDEKEIENKEISNLNSLITIPVDVLEMNGKTKVAFLFSAQWFDLNLPQHESVESIKMLKKAISEGTPLRFSYHNNKTTEISKILSAGDEGKEYLKRFKNNETDKKRIETTEATRTLTSVLPNSSAVFNLLDEFFSYDCARTGDRRKPYCIPFNFITDGCAARANKMTQIINGKGYSCKKIFVYGNLMGKSDNSACCYFWGYHVAVLVRYKKDSRTSVDVVLDPSISNFPLPIDYFKSLLTVKACATKSTGQPYIYGTFIADSRVYYRSQLGTIILYDNSYGATNCILNLFKNLEGCGPLPPGYLVLFNNCDNSNLTKN